MTDDLMLQLLPVPNDGGESIGDAAMLGLRYIGEGQPPDWSHELMHRDALAAWAVSGAAMGAG